jgi:oxalate decarboxylase/phosphoglucose isomerase-like protein (cupin superfamily)
MEFVRRQEEAAVPQPIEDGRGASILGPRNLPLEQENPDLLASPPTDAGTLPNLKFSFAAARNRLATGGWAREVTVRELPVATTLAGVNMRLTPGGIRELHWHPNADEWQYYLSGQGRMTVFASSGKARTFDYQAGDVGYVPFAMGHYIENTGDETLRFLEMFRSAYFADVSLNQWMALTPPELVAAHLNLDPQTVAALRKDKPVIVSSQR